MLLAVKMLATQVSREVIWKHPPSFSWKGGFYSSATKFRLPRKLIHQCITHSAVHGPASGREPGQAEPK